MVVIPTPSRPVVNATQLLNGFVVQWDLQWPDGAEPDPENIVQSVERSQFPEGPWDRVGFNIPGAVTYFADVTVNSPENWYQRTYYRVVVRRVKR